jgi:hypothetical protein
MTQMELEQRWTRPEGIPGVAHRFGAPVRVCSGEEAGQTGRIVALLTLEPSPEYVVELPSGSSLVVRQNEIEATC